MYVCVFKLGRTCICAVPTADAIATGEVSRNNNLNVLNYFIFRNIIKNPIILLYEIIFVSNTEI